MAMFHQLNTDLCRIALENATLIAPAIALVLSLHVKVKPPRRRRNEAVREEARVEVVDCFEINADLAVSAG